MKASLKFREEQKPLVRAKIPINVLGFPFQSGVAAGESKELSLQLATFFDSGPSLKFAYRPNDTWNPFSFIIKTGIGPFGSPNSSSMMMSAEFNLVGQGSPSFFIHFKPKFGNFSIKKLQSSNFVTKSIGSDSQTNNGATSEDDASIEVVDRPRFNKGYMPMNGMFSGDKLTVQQLESTASGAINGFCSGAKVNATTSFPMRDKAVVKFRWGVKFPAEFRDVLKDEGFGKKRTAGISFQNIPILVMDKISIEHVDGRDQTETTKNKNSSKPVNVELTDVYFSVRRQLEFLQTENGLLRKTVEDLRSDFAGWRATDSGKNRALSCKNDQRIEKKPSDYYGSAGKAMEGHVNEESRKTLKGTSGKELGKSTVI